LLTIVIGNESFQTIDWTDGPLFIKTQIDLEGGDNYTVETETQLLTVPYAMAAKTAMSVPGLDALIERVNKLEEDVENLKYALGGYLENTHWKCWGIVDEESGILTEFEPKYWTVYDEEVDCYTIIFGSEECLCFGFAPDDICGRGVRNKFFFEIAEIDYATNSIHFSYILFYGLPYLGYEQLYFSILEGNVLHFSVQNRKLRLYFEEHKYLLFNLLEQ